MYGVKRHQVVVTLSFNLLFRAFVTKKTCTSLLSNVSKHARNISCSKSYQNHLCTFCFQHPLNNTSGWIWLCMVEQDEHSCIVLSTGLFVLCDIFHNFVSDLSHNISLSSERTHLHQRQGELQPSDGLSTRENRRKGRCMQMVHILYLLISPKKV